MRSLTGAAQPGMPSPTRSAAYVASALIPGSWANPHPHNYNLQDFPGFVLFTVDAGVTPVVEASRVSERTQKRNQIELLLIREPDAETSIVEVNDVEQRGCPAVVEIRCARRQSAQDRSFELADVGTGAADHGAA